MSPTVTVPDLSKSALQHGTFDTGAALQPRPPTYTAPTPPPGDEQSSATISTQHAPMQHTPRHALEQALPAPENVPTQSVDATIVQPPPLQQHAPDGGGHGSDEHVVESP
jgi:hypothetical protein